MDFLKNFDWSAKSIAKIIGVVLLGILAIAIAVALLSFSVRSVLQTANQSPYYGGGYDELAYDAAEEAGFGIGARSTSKLTPLPPEPGFSTGTDAEDFEVKFYNGTIRTRKLESTCQTIANLKTKDYIIFENSNKNDEACYYRFKAQKENAVEVVKLIESFKPEIFNVNVRTIKQNVEGIENELEILNSKLKSIEETLAEAQAQYDEISELATQSRDAETLAKIVESKLNLIEKLTSEKLNIKEQIERYNRSMQDQLDQLNYTFFTINVLKDVILDWKDIKENWKSETKELVRNINGVLQAVSLNLVSYLFYFAQAVLYLFISVFLLKFVWIGIKKIWKSDYKTKKKK
jgi:hypothetical protein